MKILVLCTYPISHACHGGQLRVKNIVEMYRKDGYNVKVIGVLGSDSYPREEGFLSFPGYKVLESVYPSPFLMEDYALGELFYNNKHFFNKLSTLVDRDADIIHVEQPWLFKFIKKVVDSDDSWSPKLIYGSQNIEFELKEKILSNYKNKDEVIHASELIKDLEVYAIENSDLVIYVSESDGKTLNSFKPKHSVLASNGVADWVHSKSQNILANTISKNKKFVLYCASGHPPNVTGFFHMFGGGFGSLTPDQRLIIVGGAGNAIGGDPRVHESAKLAEKIDIAGIVSSEMLHGLIDTAHCIILPLTQGGGTNLKTAEALWSGKYILATSVAMRGFEKFISSPGVFVEDDPALFKKRLRDIMSMPNLSLSDDEVKKRSSVLWNQCLQSLLSTINYFWNDKRNEQANYLDQ